ncbi:MAG: hypothetical protein ACRDGH_00765 [Candidatus Limnocylindria bacterium]
MAQTLGDPTQFGQRGGEPLVIVLDHPGDRHELPPGAYYPVVSELLTEGDAPLEKDAGLLRFRAQPGGHQPIGVEGPAHRPFVADFLGHL